MKARLEGPNGSIKEVKIGFSWTVLFFGFFVPLLRGDIKWTLLFLVLPTVIGYVLPIILPILGIIMAVLYNKLYLRDLKLKGYRGVTDSDERAVNQYII